VCLLGSPTVTKLSVSLCVFVRHFNSQHWEGVQSPQLGTTITGIHRSWGRSR
jgi:hypothetical protein